ncbi:MAG: hypothetical protein IMZ59_02115 [Actinobacteria bacterium]|nr:hypothetical protein [Actinomycetota bacterium]
MKILTDSDIKKLEHWIPDYMKSTHFQRGLSTYTYRMLDTIKEIYTREDSTENLLGYCGEAFIDNLQWVMVNKGYFYDDRLSRYNSYKITENYKAPPYSPRGGIDRLLETKNDIGQYFRMAIEVKNWNPYHYYREDFYEKEISPRWKLCEPTDAKVLAINECHTDKIQDQCIKDDVIILPIYTCISNRCKYEGIRYALMKFYMEFNDMVENTVNDRYNIIRSLYLKGTKTDVLASCFKLSERQIYNIIDESSQQSKFQ